MLCFAYALKTTVRLKTLAVITAGLCWLTLLREVAAEPELAATSSTDAICANLSRPCVGLVLGGGGAKGSAHIGVLKAIEDLGVPVDLIVGTSIGALVGGLYASGQSAQQIEESFSSVDWNSGYQDAISRSDIPVRRKQQLDAMPIHLDLGFDRKGLHLPQGFIQGQGMKYLVDQMLGSYPRFASFNDLPIAYRAMAADAQSGEQVILSQGDLATAMQMSMSLPGIVRPLRYDGRMLVDGGVANNLPISVAKDLGVDIVIAVDIGSPAMTEDKLVSGIAILRQLTSFLTNDNVSKQKTLLSDRDVLLEPDVDSIGLLDFDHTLEGVAVGYQIAMEQLPKQAELERLGVRAKKNSQLELHPESKRLLHQIVLHNRTRLSDAYILRRMKLKPGNHYSADDITSAVDRLYGQGTIARIRTYWDFEDGKNVLNIDVEEKEWGPGYMNFKLSLEDDFKSFSRYQLGLSYLRSNISPNGAEWYSEAEIGTAKRFYTELYWPIFNSDFFSLTSFEYQRDVADFIDTGESYGSGRSTLADTSVGLGWNIIDPMELIVSAVVGAGNLSSPAGYKAFQLSETGFAVDKIDIESQGAGLRFVYDTLDHATFPHHGIKFNAEWAREKLELTTYNLFLDSDDNIQTLDIPLELNGDRTEIDAEFNAVFSLAKHSLRGQLRYQSLISDESTALLEGFSLGGFLNLSGNPQSFVSGNHVRFASLIYTYELVDNHFGVLNLPLYLGGSLEAGNAWESRADVDSDDLIHSGSLFVGWDSPLGPMYLAYGQSDSGESSFYFYLGRVF